VSYWDKKGEHQAYYEKAWKEFVPPTGPSHCVAGEMLRASSKLYYDLYNNGMGNNTSGPINFLISHKVIDKELYDIIYPWTRGKVYGGSYNENEILIFAMERMVNCTLEHIINNQHLIEQKNTEDMFDYQESMIYDEDDEEDDEYYY